LESSEGADVYRAQGAYKALGKLNNRIIELAEKAERGEEDGDGTENIG
jgi:hypothetical protein